MRVFVMHDLRQTFQRSLIIVLLPYLGNPVPNPPTPDLGFQVGDLEFSGLPDGDPDGLALSVLVGVPSLGLALAVLDGLSLGLAEIVPVPPDGLLLGLADGEADAVPVPPDGVALGLAETV